MNHAATMTIGLLAGLVLAPTATRPEPDLIIVQGAEFAGIQPAATPILGEHWVDGWAFSEGEIVYQVDPQTEYTVYAFEPPVDGVRERTTIAVPLTRENRIDFIVGGWIEHQRAFDTMARGENPAIGPVTYFELGESVVRVQTGANP